MEIFLLKYLKPSSSTKINFIEHLKYTYLCTIFQTVQRDIGKSRCPKKGIKKTISSPIENEIRTLQ